MYRETCDNFAVGMRTVYWKPDTTQLGVEDFCKTAAKQIILRHEPVHHKRQVGILQNMQSCPYITIHLVTIDWLLL